MVINLFLLPDPDVEAVHWLPAGDKIGMVTW